MHRKTRHFKTAEMSTELPTNLKIQCWIHWNFRKYSCQNLASSNKLAVLISGLSLLWPVKLFILRYQISHKCINHILLLWELTYVSRLKAVQSEKNWKWISKSLSLLGAKFQIKPSTDDCGVATKHHTILKRFKTEYSFPLSLLNGMLERWQPSYANDLAFESRTFPPEFFRSSLIPDTNIQRSFAKQNTEK